MYNKIFAKILDSSIWLESDAVRIVWVTCLAAMDEDGMCVFASPANLAHRANVTLTACLAALEVLEGPDPNSSDPDHEGRRLERVPGGWMVLNAAKYREIVTREIAMAANRRRVARHREKRAAGNGPVTVANDSVTISGSESYTESRSGSETHTRARAVEPVSARSPQTSADVPAVKGSGRNVGRLFLHRWQLDALIDTLGPLAEGFHLDSWIESLNDSLAGKALPRNSWKWVQEQLHAEIARRNLPRVESQKPMNGTPVNEPGDCPHTPRCDAPGRWECVRLSQIAALKAAEGVQ